MRANEYQLCYLLQNDRICPLIKIESTSPSSSSYLGRIVLRRPLTAEELASGLDFTLVASVTNHSQSVFVPTLTNCLNFTGWSTLDQSES